MYTYRGLLFLKDAFFSLFKEDFRKTLNLQNKVTLTISVPIWSFPKMENSIGSVVVEILSYRQNVILLYVIGLVEFVLSL